MSSYAGVLKIARFNWPWYVAAAVVTIAGILLLRSRVLGETLSMLGLTGLLVADLWLIMSLAVSHYIYDRSAVSRGEWLGNVGSASVGRAAIFHAGQDEATDVVTGRLISSDVEAFDFYDPERNGTASLERARSEAVRHATPIAPDAIPLEDDALDLGLLVFAAHEIRDEAERVLFFQELARLSPLNRQMFIVHTLFLCVILTLFGSLSLFAPSALLQPTRLSQIILGGIAGFWALRFIVQWFVYDWQLWRGNRFNTAVHAGFTLFWLYLSAVYGVILYNQLNMAGQVEIIN
jgi:hypothetical protein